MRFRATMMAACAAFGLSVTTAAEAKTFKWAFQGDVQSLDPHGLFETFSLGFWGNIYEPLVGYDKDLQLVPMLAAEWENVEPSTWRIELRQGVKFQNGNPFTADDVIFSWKRALTEGSDLKVPAQKIKDITKIDDYTIELETPGPNPIILRELVFLYIMDKEWAEENNTTAATNVKGGDEGNYANMNANGTGPFMVEQRQPDVKTILKRNPNYWQDIPSNVTEGIFTPIGQDATRVAALISGELDLAYPVPVQDWDRLRSAPGVRPLTGPEARTIFLGFDQLRDELLYSNIKGKNPFKDKRVRQAVAHAIDINAINQKVMRKAAVPTGLMVAPQINGFNDALNKPYPYDPEKARALLEEAGYADGFEVTIDCPNDRYVNDEKICQAIVGMLAKVGIRVDLLAQPKSKYFAKVLAQNDFDTSFYLLGWTPSSIDSHNPITSLMACRGTEANQGQFNLGGYCNERVDELAQSIQEETDPDQRQRYIDEVFKIHKSDVGHIPLHQQPLSWGVREGVKVNQRADNVLDLRYVVMP